MSGRAYISVAVMLVVALATQPSMQLMDEEELIVHPCLNHGAGEAFDVFRHCLHNINNGLQYEESEQQMERDPSTRMKHGIQAVCTRKTELLKCNQQMYESIEPCFSESKQKILEAVVQVQEAVADFACGHIDDIVAVFSSEKEVLCLATLGRSLQTCAQQTGITQLNMRPDGVMVGALDSIMNTAKICRIFDGVRNCAVSSGGNCANSRAMSLFDTVGRDVVDGKICSQNGIETSVGSAKSGSGSKPLVLLGVTASLLHILRL